MRRTQKVDVATCVPSLATTRGARRHAVPGGRGRRPPHLLRARRRGQARPSLRAALVYSLGVLVQRRPSLARVLDFEDEAFALFMLLAEAHSFATSDGSVAEGLYGLERTRLTPRPRPASRATESTLRAAVTALSLASGVPDAGRERRRALRITPRQRLASVVALVALPYARDKLEKLYARLAASRGVAIGGEAALAAAVLGPANPTNRARADADRDGSPADAAAPNARADGTRRIAEDAFVRLYPWFHAACEGAVFLCWLRYLLGGGECHDPLAPRRRCTRVARLPRGSRRASRGVGNRARRRHRRRRAVPLRLDPRGGTGRPPSVASHRGLRAGRVGARRRRVQTRGVVVRRRRGTPGPRRDTPRAPAAAETEAAPGRRGCARGYGRVSAVRRRADGVAGDGRRVRIRLLSLVRGRARAKKRDVPGDARERGAGRY